MGLDKLHVLNRAGRGAAAPARPAQRTNPDQGAGAPRPGRRGTIPGPGFPAGPGRPAGRARTVTGRVPPAGGPVAGHVPAGRLAVVPVAPARPGEAPRPRTVRRRWRVRWGRLAALAVGAYLLGGLFLQQWAFWSAQRELHALDLQLRQLEARQRALLEERRHVQDDAYVDEAARQRLGLVRPGETVIQLVEPEEGGAGKASAGAPVGNQGGSPSR